MTIEVGELVAAPVKTIADVYRHAALLLEERGWCQWFSEDPDGRFCMIGAIARVTGYNDLGRAAHHALIETIPSGPMNFNDEPGRTAAEVTAALRAAADAYEAR